MFYVPGQHPGVDLLPPKVIRKYKSLPATVEGQIFDDGIYDIYGKMALAYEGGEIDSPVGKAKKDYEKWLKEDAQAA